MADSVKPRSRTRMAGNENQLSITHAGFGPLEIIFNLERLTVLINSHQRHVDIEAREVEVIGIAAEECGLKLRHKHYANVVVAFVAIQIVLTTLIESYYIAMQTGCLIRFGLDRTNSSAAGSVCLS